jgi:hypothetical protein
MSTATTAGIAAAALADLEAAAPGWLPPVSHWEITQGPEGSWEIDGQVAVETEDRAHQLLTAAAQGRELDDNGQTMQAHTTWRGVRLGLWWQRPFPQWPVPETCATCPTKIGGTVAFVRLGAGQDAPVICVPCRDRMHAAWTAGTSARLMVYRIGLEGIPLDYYLHEADARRHCEDIVRDERPNASLEFDWLEDEDDVEEPRELTARVDGGEERSTLYTVTPLPVATAYDPSSALGGGQE